MTPIEIKQLRKELGLTQQDLANELNVSLSAVFRWEQGLRSPGGSSVRLMEKLLQGQEKEGEK